MTGVEATPRSSWKFPSRSCYPHYRRNPEGFLEAMYRSLKLYKILKDGDFLSIPTLQN